MSTTDHAQLYCPNGHPGPFESESRFCGRCGAPLKQAPIDAEAPAPGPSPLARLARDITVMLNKPLAKTPSPSERTTASSPPAQSGDNHPSQPPPPQKGSEPNAPVAPASPPAQPEYTATNAAAAPSSAGENVVNDNDQTIPPLPTPTPSCDLCQSEVEKIPAGEPYCPQCHRLRPLIPGYSLDVSAFQWSLDSTALAKLRTIDPLNKAARFVSDKVGRRWTEATFNAVQLGPSQLPDVYALAVLAARITGLPYMPDVYLSGDRMWDAATYGSDKSAFIVLGTALVTNFRGPDLLFIIAREMGHCRAGHALWKTVIRFLLGDKGSRKGFAGDGLLSVLNPLHLLEGVIELPLLAWARQSEITADRAGALAVGSEEIARRALMTWSLKSAALFRTINLAAWLEQMDDDDEQVTRLSEIATSPTPYITRRLKLLTQFCASPSMGQWGPVITPPREADLAALPARATPGGLGPVSQPQAAATPGKASVATASTSSPPTKLPASTPRSSSGSTPPSADLRLTCPACRTPLRLPRSILAGKAVINVRCPNTACRKVMSVKGKVPPA